jgi:hypothetical protein
METRERDCPWRRREDKKQEGGLHCVQRTMLRMNPTQSTIHHLRPNLAASDHPFG